MERKGQVAPAGSWGPPALGLLGRQVREGALGGTGPPSSLLSCSRAQGWLWRQRGVPSGQKKAPTPSWLTVCHRGPLAAPSVAFVGTLGRAQGHTARAHQRGSWCRLLWVLGGERMGPHGEESSTQGCRHAPQRLLGLPVGLQGGIGGSGGHMRCVTRSGLAASGMVQHEISLLRFRWLFFFFFDLYCLQNSACRCHFILEEGKPTRCFSRQSSGTITSNEWSVSRVQLKFTYFYCCFVLLL